MLKIEAFGVVPSFLAEYIKSHLLFQGFLFAPCHALHVLKCVTFPCMSR